MAINRACAIALFTIGIMIILAGCGAEVVPNDTIPESEILFEDDFSTNNNLWYVGEDNDMIYEYVDATYQITIKNLMVAKVIAIPIDHYNVPEYYTISTDFKSCSGGGGYGYLFNQDARNLGNYFKFLIDSDGAYMISELSDGQHKQIIPWTNISQYLNRGANQITMARNAMNYTFFVNGHKVISYDVPKLNDNPGPALYVQSSSSDQELPFILQVDNMKMLIAPRSPRG